MSQIPFGNQQQAQTASSLGQGGHNRRGSGGGVAAAPTRISPQQFDQMVGSMCEMAHTAHGSSYIQASLRDPSPNRYQAVKDELLPHAAELLLDTHGCYVVRTLMEQMPKEELNAFIKELAKDEAMVFELCTGSLHTRRIVQFLLDTEEPTAREFLSGMMEKRCNDVARTQQGCIVIQRVLDCASPERRKAIYDTVQRNVAAYSMDPYANYVAQYMFEVGDKESNSHCVIHYLKGSIMQLACDKYASNVVEKALHFTTPEAQHAMVTELYDTTPERLMNMIQDSYGNYIIQSTIALCGLKDVWYVAEKLHPVLHMTPYGYKIASKLERRLNVVGSQKKSGGALVATLPSS
jgi:hypothetical protein